VNTEIERYLAVTPEQIRDVAARYLHTDNHALIEIIPSPEGTERAEPAADSTVAEQAEVEQPGAPPPQVPTHPPAPEPNPPTETPETPITQATSDK
ncbi:MAG TPA: hypothetical protein VGB61_07415, partial [Pyrinomonadaceae bacterium]